MVMTLIVIAALLAGAAALTQLQLSSGKSATLQRTSTTALYCAEAGLAKARSVVSASYPQWNSSLGQTTEPAWLASIDHDVDDDGAADFEITLRDNHDDADLTRDNDLAIYIVSTCIKYEDVQTTVTELVRWNGAGNCYQAQLGGCGGNNNAN